MPESLPTIKVHFKSGKFKESFRIINERDFDIKLHTPWEIYEDEKKKSSKPEPVKTSPKVTETKVEPVKAAKPDKKFGKKADDKKADPA